MTKRADVERIGEVLLAAAKLFGGNQANAVYHLECMAGLFDLARFKEGQRVRLLRTPEITKEKSWGWLGAKHFLVTGAIATVRTVEVQRGPPVGFCYGLVFDDESWVNSVTGAVNKLGPEDSPNLYMFGESWLEPAP